MALAKSLYALPTWTRTVALVREHPALAAVIAPDGDVPSVYACYRFTAKLREHTDLLEGCIARVVAELKKRNPLIGMGRGDRRLRHARLRERAALQVQGRAGTRDSTPTPTPPGATAPPSRRARAAASTATASTWRSAPRPTFRSHGGSRRRATHETLSVAPLLDKLHALGIDPETCALDKGYDNNRVYADCSERGHRPGDPAAQDARRQARASTSPRRCEHGEWRFAGADRKREATQVALPDRRVQARVRVDQGRPAAPADPARDAALEGPLPRPRVGRAGFGRLKNEWALAPLRVRRIERVRLHADLTILSQLSCALNQERTVALAA